ncbi:MAG: hypothetical protein ACP5PS_03660, partial [Bacteroidales bacterium]
MNRLLVVCLFAVVVIFTGCASKRYARKGAKFEKAGLWEMAAQSYLQSLSRKSDNIDAIVGLRRAGQRVVDENCANVVKAYQAEDLKRTVYIYLKTDSLRTKASAYMVELVVSEVATQCFKDALPRYIENLYNDAQALLEEEKFFQAELLLAEIKKIQPDYENVQELIKISKCEPLYRQAKLYMNDGLYRKAYTSLDKIIREFSDYKDANQLREEALQKATITIKVNEFTAFPPHSRRIAALVYGAVIEKLNNLNNPFIKVIDANSTNQIIDEQRKSDAEGGNIAVGKLLVARAFLNGELNVIQISEGDLVKKEKRGYIREETKTKDSKTGEVNVKVTYRKTVYHIYEQENKVSLAFKFQLTSTETG